MLGMNITAHQKWHLGLLATIVALLAFAFVPPTQPALAGLRSINKPVSADRAIFNFLRLASAPAGSIEMAVDGTTPKKFGYQADGDSVISRVNFVMECSTAPTDREFCDLTSLTNGLKIEIIDTDGSTVLLDFMAGLTLKENRDFALFAGSDVSSGFANTNNRSVFVRWTLAKAFGGQPLWLGDNQHLQITVQDNIDGLVTFMAKVQGAKL